MPARCHDDRPPLFARGPDRPENGHERLPEPSPPPWQGALTLPAEFYRPVFALHRHVGGATVLARPLLRIAEAPPAQALPAADWE
jgi:hypothetical protein